MTIPPRHAIHDAVSNIEDLLRVIRREVSDQEAITTEFTTESRAQAFISLKNNLGSALTYFRTLYTAKLKEVTE